MTIKIWNAFASNNSGSYTIVGVFQKAIAAELARELAEMCEANHAWMEVADAPPPSPLETFIATHGLRARTAVEWGDDWPQYGPAPQVGAIGHRVVVHVPYTVTMPATFGELFYQRGGRVEVELNHAHDPVVTEIGIGWKYGTDEALVASEAAAVRAEILADPVVAAALRETPDASPVAPPRFRAARGWMEPAVTVGAVFYDVVAGARAIAAIAERHGAHHTLRVIEALDANDPVGYLGPPAAP